MESFEKAGIILAYIIATILFVWICLPDVIEALFWIAMEPFTGEPSWSHWEFLDR